MMLSVARNRERESPYFCDRLLVEPTKISVCGRKAERGGDRATGVRGSDGDGARGNERERRSESESESERRSERETESGRE